MANAGTENLGEKNPKKQTKQKNQQTTQNNNTILFYIGHQDWKKTKSIVTANDWTVPFQFTALSLNCELSLV